MPGAPEDPVPEHREPDGGGEEPGQRGGQEFIGHAGVRPEPVEYPEASAGDDEGHEDQDQSVEVVPGRAARSARRPGELGISPQYGRGVTLPGWW